MKKLYKILSPNQYMPDAFYVLAESLDDALVILRDRVTDNYDKPIEIQSIELMFTENILM